MISLSKVGSLQILKVISDTKRINMEIYRLGGGFICEAERELFNFKVHKTCWYFSQKGQ